MRYILKRPLVIFLMAVMIIILGSFSMMKLPIKLIPHVNDPSLYISAYVDKETNLNELEKEVVEPLEAIALHEEVVKDVNVTTTTRSVDVRVTMNNDSTQEQIDKLKEEFNQKLNSVSIELDHYRVKQYSSSDNVILVLALTSDHPDQEMVRHELLDGLVPALRGISGVKKVEHPFHRYDAQYVFKIKQERLTSLQQSSKLIQQLRSEFSSPILGTVFYNGERYGVRSESSIASPEDLRNFRLQSGERLVDVVDIEEERPADHSFFMLNDKPYYEIDLFASANASEVEISKQVHTVLRELHSENANWDYIIPWDASTFIGGAVSDLVKTILIGASLASIILFIVFKSFRTMLVIGLSIPISIFSAFIAMNIFGYTINLITLMGIGLGTGMIVDAGIVVLENIFRKLQDGMTRLDAIIGGTKEVISPVISSVLTTVAVFLPIAFLDGMIGEIMAQMALTVTVSLLTSLMVAITFIPILANKLLENRERKNTEKRYFSFYRKILDYTLKRKWRTLLSFILVLILSIYALIAFVPKEYMPNVSDRSLFIRYRVDEKVDNETNFELISKAAKRIKEIDGVKDVLYYGYEGQNNGTFIVLFEDKEKMTRSEDEVKTDIRKEIDQEIPYSFLSIGAGQGDTSGQMSISLSSSSAQSLGKHIEQVKQELSLISGVTGVEAALAEDSKEWVINFSREKLSHYGLSRQEIEQYISLVLNGVNDIKLNINGQNKTISLEFPYMYRESSDALYQLPLKNELALTVDDLADISLQTSESKRTRKNGEYEIPLTVYFENDKKEEVHEQANTFINRYNANDLSMELGGTQQEQDEAFADLLFSIGMAFATVFVILTVQFNRIRQPFLIMLSLPFAIIGVSIGFLVTGRSFDSMAMIGIVMLVGIVVNNAIVLIDFINKHRSKQDDLMLSIIEAAEMRLRPIFTTTMTTVGGLIPMFIGGSNSSDFQTPIATSVVFGLLFSTFVTLILVPVLYYIFETRRWKFQWNRKRKKRQTSETDKNVPV